MKTSKAFNKVFLTDSTALKSLRSEGLQQGNAYVKVGNTYVLNACHKTPKSLLRNARDMRPAILLALAKIDDTYTL